MDGVEKDIIMLRQNAFSQLCASARYLSDARIRSGRVCDPEYIPYVKLTAIYK